MKANELRIGNWIKYTDSLLLKELRRNQNIKATADDIAFLSDQGEVDYVAGISLTPEILEKAGFGITKEGLFFLDLDGLFEIVIDDADEKPYVCLLTETSKYAQPLNIHYLHQLQNLYFALTGEELQIEL